MLQRHASITILREEVSALCAGLSDMGKGTRSSVASMPLISPLLFSRPSNPQFSTGLWREYNICAFPGAIDREHEATSCRLLNQRQHDYLNESRSGSPVDIHRHGDVEVVRMPYRFEHGRLGGRHEFQRNLRRVDYRQHISQVA